ncbi:MAG: cobalamin B12-binding domain-containing protein, partial [Chitinophagaceae bacterium]
SEGNTRYYDNIQLRRLLNIVSLMNGKYKISELCSMTDEKLFSLLRNQNEIRSAANENDEYFIAQLIAAGIDFDELLFEKIFSACLLRFGIKHTYTRVISPVLVRIGMLWSANNIPPAAEHFISNVIRQKLFSAIDSLPTAKTDKESWLLFLPENEFHEIGLLFASYLIRSAGKKVIYLGANVPYDSIETTVKKTSPSHLLFFLIHNNIPEDSGKYLAVLRKNFKYLSIHLSGNPDLLSKLNIGKGMNWIKSPAELERILT